MPGATSAKQLDRKVVIYRKFKRFSQKSYHIEISIENKEFTVLVYSKEDAHSFVLNMPESEGMDFLKDTYNNNT